MRNGLARPSEDEGMEIGAGSRQIRIYDFKTVVVVLLTLLVLASGYVNWSLSTGPQVAIESHTLVQEKEHGDIAGTLQEIVRQHQDILTMQNQLKMTMKDGFDEQSFIQTRSPAERERLRQMLPMPPSMRMKLQGLYSPD